MSIVDEYLNTVGPTQRAPLEHVRDIIEELAPDAEVAMSYGMPVYKWKGKYLIGLAAFKEHMSIFPGAEAIETAKGSLNGFKISKGTVQFTAEKQIPEAIIRAIVANRLESIRSQ